MDIDKLYLEYCGHNPEEVTWEFRNCMKYKIFHDAANIVIAEMKKTCGGCCNGEEIVKNQIKQFYQIRRILIFVYFVGRKEMLFNKNKNKYQKLHLEQAIKITKMEWGMDIK